MKSTKTKVDQLEGLLHTRDLTLREGPFVETLVRMRDANTLGSLTDKQVAFMDSLYEKHFA
jgi:hypothetical protein